MIKKTLLSDKGNVFIWLIIIIVIFSGISALVFDFGNIYLKAKKVKNAINKSVKAGTLAVEKGEDLANGNFIINTDRANANFKQILANNLGVNELSLEPKEGGRSLLSEPPVIKELVVINTVPTTYNSPTMGMPYSIKKPSVLAVVEVQIKGLFIKKTLTIGKLSSAQLTSIYD